jgi:hypothetical protein
MTRLSALELTQIDEKTLVEKLRSMNLDELEFHAKELMLELGSEDYGFVMKKVMQALESEPNTDGRFTLIQNTLRDTLPNKAVMSDIYARLASIVMMIIAARYKSMLRSK